MTDDTRLPEEIKELQDELIALLRESGNFGDEDILRLWQSCIGNVDWDAKKRVGKSQAELAGELVAGATSAKSLHKLVDKVKATGKGDALYSYEKKQTLKTDICKILINSNVDTKKIKNCYLECLPDGRHPQNMDIYGMVSHLMKLIPLYGEGDCKILEFLQLLQNVIPELMSGLDSVVDRTVAQFKFPPNKVIDNYKKMEEKAVNIPMRNPAIFFKLQKSVDQDYEDNKYQLVIKSYPDGNEIIEKNKKVFVCNKSDLANEFAKYWEHIDISDENLIFIIVIPLELLSWNIDLLKFEPENDKGSFTFLSQDTPVSYCCLNRYVIPENNKGITHKIKRLSIRLQDIKTCAHVVYTHNDKGDGKDKSEIERELTDCDCSENSFASCLVEEQVIEDGYAKHLETDAILLIGCGVPAMAWMRNKIPQHRTLMPDGNFHHGKLSTYPRILWDESRRRNFRPNPIAFLLDQPEYKDIII
jgi:hypothetical protein